MKFSRKTKMDNSIKVHINDLDRNYIYISDGTWYIKDSVCFLEVNLKNGDGLFRGVVSDENSYTNDAYLDGELCQFEEFEVCTPEGFTVEVIRD